jgi:hypothetical protein
MFYDLFYENIADLSDGHEPCQSSRERPPRDAKRFCSCSTVPVNHSSDFKMLSHSASSGSRQTGLPVRSRGLWKISRRTPYRGFLREPGD